MSAARACIVQEKPLHEKALKRLTRVAWELCTLHTLPIEALQQQATLLSLIN
jgi:hypothetical protein